MGSGAYCPSPAMQTFATCEETEALPAPPTLGERRHRRLARRLIAVRRAAYVTIVAARPHPMPVFRRDRHLEDAADDDTIVQHVKAVLLRRGDHGMPLIRSKKLFRLHKVE
jgi:hypothetical protein